MTTILSTIRSNETRQYEIIEQKPISYITNVRTNKDPNVYEYLNIKSEGLNQDITVKTYANYLTKEQKQYICEFIASLVKCWISNGFISKDQKLAHFLTTEFNLGFATEVRFCYEGGRYGYLFPAKTLSDLHKMQGREHHKYHKDVVEIIKKLNSTMPLNAKMSDFYDVTLFITKKKDR